MTNAQKIADKIVQAALAADGREVSGEAIREAMANHNDTPHPTTIAELIELLKPYAEGRR